MRHEEGVFGLWVLREEEEWGGSDTGIKSLVLSLDQGYLVNTVLQVSKERGSFMMAKATYSL